MLIVTIGSVSWLCSVYAFVSAVGVVVVVVVIDLRCPTCVVALISFPAASVDCNWLASWVDWDPERARGWSSSLLAYWVVRVVVHLVEYFLDRACRHLPNEAALVSDLAEPGYFCWCCLVGIQMPCVLFSHMDSKCLGMARIVVCQLPLALDLDATPAVVGTSTWFS